ncbi:MAG: hypothetical protein AAF447_10535 [Myxococcota bacterium]
MRVTLFTGAVILGAALPSLGQAQGIAVTISELDGPGGSRTIQEDIARGVNVADCANPGATTFTFSVNSAIETQFQLWRGGASSACNTATARSGDMVECDDLGTVTVLDDNTFELTLERLLEGTADSASLCEEGGDIQGDSMSVFIFDRSGALGNGEDVPDAAFANISVLIDAARPAQPNVDVLSVSGDTSVPVSWTGLGGETNIEYQLFNDPGTRGCAPGSGRLITGSPPPADLVPLTTTGVMVTNATVNPAGLGLDIGESTLVFVAGRDNARNVGDLSDGICVTRVATFGYCDTLENMAEAGMDVETCPDGCAAGPAAPAGVALAWATLALLRRRQWGASR